MKQKLGTPTTKYHFIGSSPWKLSYRTSYGAVNANVDKLKLLTTGKVLLS